MKKINPILIFIFIAMIFTSCNFIGSNTPEQYFDQTTLNANKIMGFGQKHFTQMQQQKQINQLSIVEDKKWIPAKTYTEYVQKFMLVELNKDLEKIKKLKVTDETKPMIEASLDLFNYVKSVYENDYIKITKMMDDNQPQNVISNSIQEMENEKGPKLLEKFDKLTSIALPYAKKHGIEVKRY